MKFYGVFVIDRSDVYAQGQGQRSKVKVTEVKTRFALFWVFPEGNSSLNFTDGYKMMHKTWSGVGDVSFLFVKVIC